MSITANPTRTRIPAGEIEVRAHIEVDGEEWIVDSSRVVDVPAGQWVQFVVTLADKPEVEAKFTADIDETVTVLS